MASGLLAQWLAANGPDAGPQPDPASVAARQFQCRVAVAVAQAAINVSTEAGTVTDHANRAAFAKDALQNTGKYTGAFAIALASEGIDNTSTDVQINNMVAAVWNGFSG
jgi:hypothetical protein